MMKHLITIAALLICSLCHGQGIWNKSATNTIVNRGKDDSVRIIPRDTLPTNNALYNGSPVGNYGRIAAKHGLFYFHDSIRNRRVALYDETIPNNPANDYTFSGWDLSYHKDTANAQEGIICNIGGDTLINIFRISLTGGHSGNDGKIVKRYSPDGGLSWGEISDVFNSIYDDRNVAGGMVGDRIVVFFNEYDGAVPASVNMGSIYSDDDGATWSSFSIYSPVVAGSVPFGHIVKANGKWLQAIYHLNFSEVVQSTDGATWSNLSTMWDYRVSLTHLTSETDISYIGTDSLISITRNESALGGSGYQFKSTDNGSTWAFVGTVPFTGITKAPALAYDSARGNILYATGERSLPISENRMLLFSAPKSALSDTTKWNLSTAFQRPVPNARDLYGYPTFAQLTNGNFAMMFTDRWQAAGDTALDTGKEVAALYHSRVEYLDSGNTPETVIKSNIVTTNIQGDYYTAAKNNIALSYDTASNLITTRYPGVVTLYGKSTIDTLSIFETRTSGNNPRISFYGAKRIDGTIANFNGFVRTYGIYATNIQSTSGTFGTVVTSAIRTGQSAGKLELAGGSSGPTSYLGGQIDLLGGTAPIDPGTIIFRAGVVIGTTQVEVGRFSNAGNFNATGSIATGTQFVGRLINSGSSADSIQFFGGGSGGSRGGSITGYGGTSVSNAGVLIGRAGTAGGGVTQQEGWRLTAAALFGVRNSTPSSYLHVGGSFATAISTVTGNTTLDATHSTVRVNNTGSVTITLPTASTCTGRIYYILKISAAANDVIVSGASKTLTLQSSAITVQSNGTTWDIIGSHAAATTL